MKTAQLGSKHTLPLQGRNLTNTRMLSASVRNSSDINEASIVHRALS